MGNTRTWQIVGLVVLALAAVAVAVFALAMVPGGTFSLVDTNR